MLSFIILTTLVASATEAGMPCSSCAAAANKNVQKIQETLSDLECKKTKSKDESVKVIEALARKSDHHIQKTFTVPTSRTLYSVTYNTGNVLAPNEALYYAVPEDLQTRPIAFVVLGHRQNPETEKGYDGKWDAQPGLSSVQLHAKNNSDDPWRYWLGDASGKQGAKFAEVSHSVEIENLYEWQKYGHAGIKTDKATKEALYIDGARVVSSGQDSVEVSQLTIKFTPPKASAVDENIFSQGTVLPDFYKKIDGHFGGGQDFKGKFPGAIVLGGQKQNIKLPPGWIVSGNTLKIPLSKGKKLQQVIVAVGDSHPDEITNSDGGWGTKGWSKLNILYENKNGTQRPWLENENIAPQGFAFATPPDCARSVQTGDYLVIKGVSDAAYLMGIRLEYQ